ILSANANNPYAALEAAGEDSGLSAAMGSDWDPYGLMEQWGIEAPEESVRPEQPVEESIVPVGEMSVPKDKVPSKVKEIAGRGITSVRDLEKPDLSVRTAMDELPGQRVRFAETELSEEERKKDIVELLSSDLEYASTQEILDEASTEIADYTSASYAATNRISLMLDARKQQIQALSSEIGAEYGESVLG